MRANYTFRLHFLGGDVEKGQLPGSAAYVQLQHWTSDDEGREIFVSHQCVGPTELEAEVSRLKQELDQILTEGLKRFTRYESETIAAIDRKHRN